MIERGLVRHAELALDARMATDVGTLRPAPELGAAGFQITAWLTPFETAAHPAMVPASLTATATLGFGSWGLSLTIEPLATQADATIEPDPGSKSAPIAVPLELTAVA